MPTLPPAVLNDSDLLDWCTDPGNGPAEQRYGVYLARFGQAPPPTLNPVHRRLRNALRAATVEDLEPFLKPGDPDAPLRDRQLTGEATRQMFDLWENGVMA